METEILLNPPRWNIQGICKYSFRAGRMNNALQQPLICFTTPARDFHKHLSYVPFHHFHLHILRRSFVKEVTSRRNEASKSTPLVSNCPYSHESLEFLLDDQKCRKNIHLVIIMLSRFERKKIEISCCKFHKYNRDLRTIYRYRSLLLTQLGTISIAKTCNKLNKPPVIALYVTRFHNRAKEDGRFIRSQDSHPIFQTVPL